jgi:prepilin-type N-terminal cleavage/methylation domain-containing protein
MGGGTLTKSRMRICAHRNNALGFTMTEMMVSMAIFLVICGSAFTLLGVSQQRYQAESQKLNVFQEARLGMDQIMRDVSVAGYPPPNQFQPSAGPPLQPLPNSTVTVAAAPFAWYPGYLTNTPCPLGPSGGGTCNTPWDDGFFIETNTAPQTLGSPVYYIRYKMLSSPPNTLARGVFQKTGADPYTSIPDSSLTPFVHNVMNDASPAVIAQINALYPNMFPGGAPVPVFTYYCDTPNGPVLCVNAGAYNSPTNIRSVMITLIVAAPPDPQNGQLRVMELTGEASRINTLP